MTLITVLISLVLDHVLYAHRDSRVGLWFNRAADAVAARLPSAWDGVGGAIAIVGPPVIVMLVVQWLVAGWLFGLVSLVIAVLVLLYSLGPLDIANHVEDYVDARRPDDHERTAWYFRRVTGEAPPDTPQEEGRRMVEAVLYQGHDHLFATVFWFCLLGPTGAVLYRMAAEGALRPPASVVDRPALHRSLRYVLGVLGWIPARLIAFGYAMTGSFEEALRRLRGRFRPAGDLLGSNRQLLIDAGTAALRQDRDERESGEADSADERRSPDPADVVDAARALAVRTAVLWLAVLALLTLGGWFS